MFSASTIMLYFFNGSNVALLLIIF